MDNWLVTTGWDRAADIATALTIFGLGFLVAEFWNQRRDHRAEYERLELERQEGAYRTITEQYTRLIELCLERPWLTFAWLNAGRLDDLARRELSDEEWMQDVLVYELLFETIEKAFILYRAQVLYEDPKHPGVFVMRARPTDEDLEASDFRGRQWWGWDSWIDIFAGEKLFWDRWRTVKGADTYDGFFMTYMAHKAAAFEGEAVDRGIR